MNSRTISKLIGLRYLIGWVAAVLVFAFTAPDANLWTGVLLASLVAGALFGIGTSVRLIRGTQELEAFRSMAANQRMTPWCNRSFIRGFVPFTVLLVGGTIGMVLSTYGVDLEAFEETAAFSYVGLAIFAIVLWWLTSMFFRRPRFLMPPGLRHLSDRQLAEIVSEPDYSDDELVRDEFDTKPASTTIEHWVQDADGKRRRLDPNSAESAVLRDFANGHAMTEGDTARLAAARERDAAAARSASPAPDSAAAHAADQARRSALGLPRDRD